jgi:hypothetical protein
MPAHSRTAVAGIVGGMRAAPKIDPRLVALIRRFDRPGRPIAEVNRRVGRAAEALGLTRPSYEQVRVHLHAVRAGKAASVGLGEVLLDVSFRARPPEALLDFAAGTLPPPRRR